MSIVDTIQAAPSRRLATPRIVATLALFVVSAAVFCAVLGFVLARQADDQQELSRRTALNTLMDDMRAVGGNLTLLDDVAIRGIERATGLKGLRFEKEPTADREFQSVIDRQGRIAGWLTWESDRSMTQALGKLRPLLALTGAFLIGFAGIAAWQVRRAVRALAASEQAAWTLAHQDPLTGLANHRKMTELIDQALAARATAGCVTLALMDIDGLGDINGASGQAAGDAFLAAWGARLQNVLPPGASCGRLDGDDFALVIAAADLETTEAAIAEVAGALSRAYWINDQAMQCGVTAGLAHAPLHAQTRDALMRRADLALRVAKRKARGSVMTFSPAMDREFDERRFLERELRRALTDDALDVHYQPIVTADGGRIVGVEALVRWHHPKRGAIGPATFVPVAEHAGLMGKLGLFVLRRALQDAARWPDLFVAVNMSPVQVRDRGLVDQVTELLAEFRIPPRRLVLEMTEGVLVENPEEAGVRLDALRALGVRLALDDFGTGYSSLSYLQRFRFDKLKIDKSFVEPLGRSPDSQAMLQAIVALGRALGLRLLAEGVETEEQRVLLRLVGCDQMQGYLFARPGPRESIDRLLAAPQPEMAAG